MGRRGCLPPLPLSTPPAAVPRPGIDAAVAWLTAGARGLRGCREWPFEKEKKPQKEIFFKKQAKMDKARKVRDAKIAENMAQMDGWIANFRESVRAQRRGDNLSPVDRMLLTPKQRRLKAKQKAATK